jgi:hypothetical protein
LILVLQKEGQMSADIDFDVIDIGICWSKTPTLGRVLEGAERGRRELPQMPR